MAEPSPASDADKVRSRWRKLTRPHTSSPPHSPIQIRLKRLAKLQQQQQQQQRHSDSQQQEPVASTSGTAAKPSAPTPRPAVRLRPSSACVMPVIVAVGR